MKRITKLIIVGVCCISLFSNVIYATDTSNGTEIIKIGYLENWDIFKSDCETGFEGYGYEYFEELSKYTNHTYEYVSTEMDDAFQMLEDGEIDIFGPIGITDYRMKLFKYSSTPFIYSDALLLAVEGSEIELGDINAINNKSISVLDNDTDLHQLLDDYVRKSGINVDNQPYAGTNGLLEGSYDLEVVWSSNDMEGRQIVDKLGTEPLYFVTQKDNTKLLEEIAVAGQQLIEENDSFEVRLNQKYFTDTTAGTSPLTREDELLLEKKGKSFTVLMSPDHKPFQYIDNNGNPNGIVVDILDMISMDSGIEFNYVYETDTTPIDYEKVDISIALLNTPFTNSPYTKTDILLKTPMMFVGKSKKNIENENIATLGMLDYRDFAIDEVSRLRYDNYEEMIRLLKKDEIDYIVSSDISTIYILQELGINNYSAYHAGSCIYTSILVSDKLIEYVEVFNKLIERLDQDKIETIVVKHSSDFSTSESISSYYKTPTVYLIMLLLVTISIGLVVFLVISKNKKDVIRGLIRKDELTGLISVYKFYKLAKKILQTAKPNEYVLISLDIDNFKYLNEAYGYEKGSDILVSLATQISIQYGYDSVITRERADNFLILTPKRPSIQIHSGKESFEDCIATAIRKILGAGCRTSISRGVYEIYNPLENLSYMIDCANSARRLGKSIYGNTSHQFTEDMKKDKEAANKIVNSMELALKNREFEVFYQPKVDLKKCNLMGAEALVRWFPQDGSKIFPDSFIPLFEKNGFIIDLDYYVFEEVCSFIAKWKDTMTLPIISVNISVVTLLADDLIINLLNITSKYNLDNNLLELEITESAIVENFNRIIQTIGRLKEKGFSISLDDFGSGLSSLNRLKDINVDVLKIDREFLTANLSNPKGIAIIKNIITMAKEIHVESIAEGVETKEHVEFLRKLECDYAQGYYFGKPMTEENFRDVVIHGINKK